MHAVLGVSVRIATYLTMYMEVKSYENKCFVKEPNDKSTVHILIACSVDEATDEDEDVWYDARDYYDHKD